MASACDLHHKLGLEWQAIRCDVFRGSSENTRGSRYRLQHQLDGPDTNPRNVHHLRKLQPDASHLVHHGGAHFGQREVPEMRAHLSRRVLIAALLLLTGCSGRNVNFDAAPSGSWSEVTTGEAGGLPWRLFETPASHGGRCLALESAGLPKDDDDSALYRGKAAACAPDPESVRRSIVLFAWNEQIFQTHDDGNGGLKESVEDNSSAKVWYLVGRVARGRTVVAVELEDATSVAAKQVAGTFVVFYPPDRHARFLRLSQNGKTARCPVRWADAIPEVGECLR